MTYTRRFSLMAVRQPVGKEQKPRWFKIGVAFEQEDGRLDCRLDAIPTASWDGRFYMYEVVEAEDEPDVGEPAPEETRAGWTAPEGYVPKVHYQDFVDTKKGVCGNFAKAENRTSDWEKVTCKACLKERPR